MSKQKIEQQMVEFEAEYGYSMDYARDVLELGEDVLARFHEATQLSAYRGSLSKAAWYTAQILGVMAGDCGTCVQLVATMAERDGVSPATISAVVTGKFEALPDDARLCAYFTHSLLTRSAALPSLREQMEVAYGRPGLVGVAYAVIASGMYPTLKYALGRAESCQAVAVGSDRVWPSFERIARVA